MGNVLIVDDEKSIRLTIKAFLKVDGHQLYTAENVAEALQLLRKHAMDVVVTDIIMPRISGVDLLKRIKEITPEIQVIIITGEPTVDTATEALREGAYEYLIKPISKKDIKKTVFNAVRMKKLGEEKALLAEENRRYQENLEEMVRERTRALSESEARFRDMSNLLPQTIFEIDTRGRMEFINSNGLKTYQIPPDREITGINIKDFFIPEEKENFDEFLKGLRTDSGIEDHEFMSVAHDGTQFPIHLYASRIEVDGNIVGFRGIIIDITEQKKIEKELREYHSHLEELVEDRTRQLQEKQAQLIHSGRLAALGEMATGIAHELNQPLAIIRGQAEVMKIIQRKYEDPLPDFSEELDTIMEQTDRASLIIEEMRGFVRRYEPSLTHTDITKPIDKGLVFFREQFKATKVKLKVSIPSELPQVKVSSQQFEQV
ncbi:MAG: response regulator, partial [FCB group bacterium]|nr:response regulator [FCB group bacterium]